MINIELKGQLVWYMNKRQTISMDSFEGNLQDLVLSIGLPTGEVGMVLVNQKKEPLSYCVEGNDHIVIVPVVGGG